MALKAIKTPEKQVNLASEGVALGGTILVVMGFLFLAKELIEADLFDKIWPYAWPIGLIVCGVAILIRRYHR